MHYQEIYYDQYLELNSSKGQFKVLFKSGKIVWLSNGKYHRTNGPAVQRENQVKEWFLNGKLHRIDGPAIIYNDIEKYWFLFGEEYSKEEWFEQLTSEQKAAALSNSENF